MEASRTSTYLESGSVLDDEMAGASILSAMQMDNYGNRKCQTGLKCYDMCCGGQEINQFEIFSL